MKFSTKTFILLAGVVAALAFAGAALAFSSTFDPSTGIGSVAKGDLQQLLYAPSTLNNAQIQSWFNQYGSTATFSYNSQTHWQWHCAFTTGGGQNQTAVQNVNTTVNDTIAYSNRGQTNWAGYNLTGFGSTNTSGNPPNQGDPCTVGVNSGTVDDTPFIVGTPTSELVMYWDSTSTVIPFTTP